jgi:MFS family permease
VARESVVIRRSSAARRPSSRSCCGSSPVALALFFEQYDQSMLTSALKFIARDLDMREEDLAGYLGVVRPGALPAFLVIPFADRIGRRRVFLASVIGISMGTFLTAFTRTPSSSSSRRCRPGPSS